MEEVRELPAILLTKAFISIGVLFRIEISRHRSVAMLSAMAKGALGNTNRADYFDGNFVLIVYSEKQLNFADVSKSVQKDYNGIVFETKIHSCNKIGGDKWELELMAVKRVRFVEFGKAHPFYTVKVSEIAESNIDSEAAQSAHKRLIGLTEKMEKDNIIHREYLAYCLGAPNLSRLADNFIYNWPLKGEGESFTEIELRRLAGTLDVARRLGAVVEKIETVLQMRNSSQGVSYRKYALLKQLTEVRTELKALCPQEDFGGAETNVEEWFAERIEKAGMTEEARLVVQKELIRLSRLQPSNPEYIKLYDYLEWLCALPWSAATVDNLDINHARQVLDEDHYGLEKPKKMIIEFLAVKRLKPDKKGFILCLVGPPGVGKTSLGKSIARAMGRRYARVSLGGVRDEAEIRGHRRTYIGALPGRIIQMMKRAQSNNPVICLDEIDKLGQGRGNSASALLEVLDPEQNKAFSDHYLAVGYDLSQVLFITTANRKSPIPPALRDRMFMVEIHGYTSREKMVIAKNFLVPKETKEHGVTNDVDVNITDEALQMIISRYTREAGVRKLEEKIAAICRYTAVETVNFSFAGEITPDNLPDILGPPEYEKNSRLDVYAPGIATGLVKSQAGGSISFVEAVKIPKAGKRGILICTGNIGKVMRESAQVAYDYARKFLLDKGLITEPLDEKYDVHVHFPAGAVEKEGPSGGGVICLAIVSAVIEKAISTEFAMTGELTSRENGKLLPIGGIKDKLLVAYEAGCLDVCIPRKNNKDLAEAPQEVRDGLNIILAENIEEVIALTLGV